jgi:hypothetical protein
MTHQHYRKTEQFTENKTPAQAFTPTSVGEITSHVSFVSTSVPGSFLEQREAVGFVYLFLTFFVICIVHNSD